MQDLELGFKNIYDKVDVCAKKMLSEEIEEKWGKNKESRSLGFRRTVARDLRLRDSGGFGFIRFGPHNCAEQQLFVLIFIILFILNLVAEAIWWQRQIYTRAATIVKVAFVHC